MNIAEGYCPIKNRESLQQSSNNYPFYVNEKLRVCFCKSVVGSNKNPHSEENVDSRPAFQLHKVEVHLFLSSV